MTAKEYRKLVNSKEFTEVVTLFGQLHEQLSGNKPCRGCGRKLYKYAKRSTCRTCVAERELNLCRTNAVFAADHQLST